MSIEIKDFFETNSTSLDVKEIYDEFGEERSKKSVPNAVLREIADEYADERDQEILMLMTVYWCALQKGFVHEKLKEKLDKITKEEIIDSFGDEDGEVVFNVLSELLISEPVPQVRKKIDYSNPGSKNWKHGDIFAYQLGGKDAEEAGISGKYAIIYVQEIEKYTRQQNKVIVYVFLCDEPDLEKELSELLRTSFRVMSIPLSRYYRFLICAPHHDYPYDKILYLGNIGNFERPIDEVVPISSLFLRYTDWDVLNFHVSLSVLTMKKFNLGSP